MNTDQIVEAIANLNLIYFALLQEKLLAAGLYLSLIHPIDRETINADSDTPTPQQ